LQQFLHEFGSEEQCRRTVYQMRWPNGFRCPSCGHHSHCQLHTRALIECHRCHHQASLTAGTVMAHTKLPLTQWFLAMYLLTQSKTGISAMELKRHLGVRYPTAWLLKQKLMQTMRERDDETPLSGQVQVDDAFWGGERRGGKRGRGAAGKTAFVAAVACSADGRPLRLRMTPIKGFSSTAIRNWAQSHLASDSEVISDGLPCFRAIGRFARITIWSRAADEPVLRYPSSTGSIPLWVTSRMLCSGPTMPFVRIIWDGISELSPGDSTDDSNWNA
jgi:transposase-like protein